MKKSPVIVTPRRRGRPPKRELVSAAESAPQAGEGVSQIGTRLSDVVSNSQADISGPSGQNVGSNVKNRSGSSLSSSAPSATKRGRKRKQTSSDAADGSADGKKSSSSTPSSGEKMDNLSSEKQHSVKMTRRLKSQSSPVSRKGRSSRILDIAKRNISSSKGFFGKRPSRTQSVQALAKELKRTVTSEMRRLLTTDGFWSSKPVSRSSSPLDEVLPESSSQKQPVSQKKGSRVSTPDVLPPVKRKLVTSASKIQADKEEAALQKLNNSVMELRRLRTTEGFWSANTIPTSSQTDSRDGSPSSSISQERGVRQSARSVNKSNELKSVMQTAGADEASGVDDVVPPKTKMKAKKTVSGSSGRMPEEHKQISEAKKTVSGSSGRLPEEHKQISEAKKTVSGSSGRLPEEHKQISEAKKTVSGSSGRLPEHKQISEAKKTVSGSSGRLPEEHKQISEAKKTGSSGRMPEHKQVSETKKTVSGSSGRMPEEHKQISQPLFDSASTDSTQQTDLETPISRFTKKKSSKIQLGKSAPTKKYFSSNLKRGKVLSLVQRSSKYRKLKGVSSLSKPVMPDAVIDPVSTSESVTQVKKRANLSKHSPGKRLGKTSPVNISVAGVKRFRKKLSGTDSRMSQSKSEDLSGEDLNVPLGGGVIPPSNGLTSDDIAVLQANGPETKLSSCPEFVISDLFGSAELRRLNTTAGFWAASPDVGVVLGINQVRRLRDVDVSSTKRSFKLRRHMTPQKFQKGKKLHKFQKSIKKDHQQVSSLPLTEHLNSVTLQDSMPPSSETFTNRKPKPKTCYFGARKRKYKKHSQLHSQAALVNVSDEFIESESSHVDTSVTDTPPLERSAMDTSVTDTPPLERSTMDTSVTDTSPLERSTMDTSVTDTPPLERSTKKTWKRGRRKMIPGEVRFQSVVGSVKTRGRRKADSNVDKSLAVLQDLEPDREDKPACAADKMREDKPACAADKMKEDKPACAADKMREDKPACAADKMREDKPACAADKMKEDKPACAADKMREDKPACAADKMKEDKPACAADKMREDKPACAADKMREDKPACAADKMGNDIGRLDSNVEVHGGDKDRYMKQDTEISKNEDVQDINSENSQEFNSKMIVCQKDNDDSNKLDVYWKQNSGHKKDNLFESLGDLYIPSEISAPNMKLSPEVNETSLSVMENFSEKEPELIKSDDPAQEKKCDLEKEDESCESEAEILVKSTAEHNESPAKPEELDAVKDVEVSDASKVLADGVAEQIEPGILTQDYCSVGVGLSSVAESQQLCDHSEHTSLTGSEPDICADKISDSFAEKVVAETVESSFRTEEDIVSDVGDGSKSGDTSLGESATVGEALCLQDNKASQEMCETDIAKVESSTSSDDDLSRVSDVCSDERQVTELEHSCSDSCATVEGESGADEQGQEQDRKLVDVSQDDAFSIVVTGHISDTAEVDTFHSSESSNHQFPVAHDLCQDESLKVAVVDSEKHSISRNDFEEITEEISNNVPLNGVLNDHEISLFEGETSKQNLVEHCGVTTVDATEGISFNKDISAAFVENLSDTAVIVKPHKKRKKQTTRFFRRKIHKTTSEPAVSNALQLTVEREVSDNLLDNNHEFVTDNMSGGLHTAAGPGKEPLKRVRKRKRNAWRRGVLRKAGYWAKKVSRQGKSDRSLTLVKQQTTSSQTGVPEADGTASGDTEKKNSGDQSGEEYSPAVRKSLKNVMKKLETNANLAHAIFDADAHKGRCLRAVQPRQPRDHPVIGKKYDASSDANNACDKTNISTSDKTEELRIEIPGDCLPVKRKRGRPRKHRDDSSLPKLTPLHTLPTLRPATPWNQAPPNLSPQVLATSVFFDSGEPKAVQESEFVCESVDDSDLHLYLSGVSDEEQSPKKDSTPASVVDVVAEIPAHPVEEDVTNKTVENKLDVLDAAEPLATQKTPELADKEPRKLSRPKMKGRKGRPPGIPMTDEERKQKAILTQVPDVSDLLGLQSATGESMLTLDVCNSPHLAGDSGTLAGKFSLRKKSTRSPLEMLEMKRKREEERYDLEQERRQARLIHLREKRCARESGDGFSDDGDGVGVGGMLHCSVVLSDFVKKLQLDGLETCSGEEVSRQAVESVNDDVYSPEYYDSEDKDDEDWCADLEDQKDDEWNDNRPHIPRLKLKRVLKKGTPSQIKRTKLKPQSPKDILERKRQQPIKLVIKTEPGPDPHEHAGPKSSSFVETSKADKSGFENSYMDFLKGKSQSLPEKSSRRRVYTSRSAQPETKSADVPDLDGAVEILSLPAPGVRNSSVVGSDSSTKIDSVVPVAECLLARTVAHALPLAASVSVDKRTETAEVKKRLSSVDEEDDDILILDLEDGTVDEHPGHLFKEGHLATASSASKADQVPLNTAVGSPGNTPQNNEITHQNKSAHEENDTADKEAVNRPQRSLSNDEMGLMLESYNIENDNDAERQLNAKKDASVSLAEALKKSLESDQAKGAGNVPIDRMEDASVGVSLLENVESETQHSQSAIDPTDELVASHETQQAVDIEDVSAPLNTVDKETLNVEGHGVKGIKAHATQDEREAVENSVSGETTQSKEAGFTEESRLKVASDSSSSELTVVVSDTTDVQDAASHDNNNVTPVFKSPANVSVKKPGLSNDTNKSLKHPSYHGSEPEEWRVKVILHSDKFPSGKYSCKRCGFTTPAKLTIESHIYSHIPGVQFRCAYCESEFSSMAAASSHLKNTHSLNEAKLHISCHIDEKNFYDREAAVFSEENSQQSPAQSSSTIPNTGGQSPPVIISVVVSGTVGSSRSGRSIAPARRFVCTHCGFSTNVKEDAEHHVLDLHPSQTLFACVLCSESICYTEKEIKDHCAMVHPARNHPYRKLPDFYDAEQLSLKEKNVSQDDRENIFERMTSIFQDETQTSTVTIDHKQKAKEYLYLQEGWREKTRVEADSTTADDSTEGQSTASSPSPEDITENTCKVSIGENEASDHPRISSADVAGRCAIDPSKVSGADADDAAITSSAKVTTKALSVDAPKVLAVASDELQSNISSQEKTWSSEQEESSCHSALGVGVCDDNQDSCQLPPPLGDENELEDSPGEGMGLKIVEVVSLCGKSEDLTEKEISEHQAENEHVDAGFSIQMSDSSQTNTASVESGMLNNGPELSVSEHSSALSESEMLRETQGKSKEERCSFASASESSAPDASGSNTAAACSSASPSLAGGLPLSYKCNACKVHTPYLLMMVKHLKAKHPNMHCFACPYCKITQSFASQKQLRHHVKQFHPDKFGRNEIALSEDAKKFVEAMVLPMGPECIRVGSRIVLEEDIHTCTYCQVKMISLANVYEHLSCKHSDLFEFVCPVCQSFKSKVLTEISEHCLKTHMSSLDTDKVHVSVPKNLFTALTCISKNGKYIEKSLDAGAEGKSTISEQSEKTRSNSGHDRKSAVHAGSEVSAGEQPTLKLPSSSVIQTPEASVHIHVPVQQATQPVFAIPLVSAGIGAIPTVATSRPIFAISSALFDTSSLTAAPQLAVASQAVPIIPSAGASSFLSPLPKQANANRHHAASSKQQSPSQLHSKPHEKPKSLPVLNVPTIKPRASSLTTKPVTGARRTDASLVDQASQNALSASSDAPPVTVSRLPGSSPSIDSIPDDEPNPDAFKIFNLRPTGPLVALSPSSSPAVSPGIPTVYPPVSVTMTPGYIQGPIAGFPPSMVISSNMLPLSFPFSQHQPLVQGLLAQKQGLPQSSQSLRHPRISHPSSTAPAVSLPTPAVRNSFMLQEATPGSTMFLKKQQQKELYLLKKQRQLQAQRQQFLGHKPQQAIPRAYPAHQQPPSLSGQVYQPQPLAVSSSLSADQQQPPSLSGQMYQPQPLSVSSSLSADQQQQLPGPSNLSKSSFFTSQPSALSSSPSLPSSVMSSAHSSSLARSHRGVHKRSSSLYQCPYCPVTLKPLEVASHIQQHHPGKQVAFRKIL